LTDLLATEVHAIGQVSILDDSDFTLFVLPLGILVFILVAAVLFFVKREEIANERKIKYISAYSKERMK